MAEPTHAPQTEDTPRAFGWCAWHKGTADGVRLIDVIEQGSGSGGTLFACGPCREVHGLVPFADRR
ncbi:hypothetical protein [Streptomyces sp. KR55]|uniref:hypothetical protein n=1 Tax=Streptomyces sp. KR55 TaxID=3457425 RepID=UPI003FD4536E